MLFPVFAEPLECVVAGYRRWVERGDLLDVRLDGICRAEAVAGGAGLRDLDCECAAAPVAVEQRLAVVAVIE